MAIFPCQSMFKYWRIRADLRTRLREETYTGVKIVNVELQTSNSIFTIDDVRKSKTILLEDHFKIEKKNKISFQKKFSFWKNFQLKKIFNVKKKIFLKNFQF